MVGRHFDPYPGFDEDDEMAGRRRGPHGPPPPPRPPHGPHHHGPPPPPPPPPPGFGPPAPPWAPWGAGWLGGMFGRGPRARRGNVRSAILTLLAERPHNGYQIMQAIEQRSHGSWKPSSGSVYPTLAQLEDEGLVEPEEAGSGQTASRTFKLTAKGKRYVEDHRDELEADWNAAGRGEDPSKDPRREMASLFRGVAAAAMQVAQVGTASQLEEAKRLLHDVRRGLYKILAEAPPDEDVDE